MTATAERTEPRAVLAMIALAADLPMPASVRFCNDADSALLLDFDLLSGAAAWCMYLGGEVHQAVEHDGRRWFRTGRITWQGWDVHLSASEPVAAALVGEALPRDIAERLSSLVPSVQAAA